jgi:hypothetical protein
MKKNCLLGLIGGVRYDSGATTSGSYVIPTAMDLIEQKKDNIVMKISNINNLPHGSIKFTELKKEK